MNEIDKQLHAIYGCGKESIKDVNEALNLLRIHGEKCEVCFHRSIREKVYKKFKNTKTHNK